MYRLMVMLDGELVVGLYATMTGAVKMACVLNARGATVIGIHGHCD